MIDTCHETVTLLSVFGLLSVVPSGGKYSEIKGSYYYQVAKLVIKLHKGQVINLHQFYEMKVSIYVTHEESNKTDEYPTHLCSSCIVECY